MISMGADKPCARSWSQRGVLRTYVINLDRAPDRLAYMDAQLRELGIGYERFQAVDRYEIDASVPEFDASGYARLHGRRFHSGEVACYLSHVGVLRAFLRTDASHALILEDDARLSPDLMTILEAAMARTEEWDILRLSSVNTGLRIPYSPLTGDYRFAIALTREKGAAGYVVNRACAESFLDNLLPMRLAWDIAFDMEFLHGLKSVFVEPLPVGQKSNFATQVQTEVKVSKLPRTRYLTVFPYRAGIETRRFLYRGMRLLKGMIQVRSDRRGESMAR